MIKKGLLPSQLFRKLAQLEKQGKIQQCFYSHFKPRTEEGKIRCCALGGIAYLITDGDRDPQWEKFSEEARQFFADNNGYNNHWVEATVEDYLRESYKEHGIDLKDEYNDYQLIWKLNDGFEATSDDGGFVRHSFKQLAKVFKEMGK